MSPLPSGAPAEPAPDTSIRTKRWVLVFGIVLLATAAALFVRWRDAGASTATRAREAQPVSALPAAPAAEGVIRIAVGGARDPIADSAGNIWQRDQFFTGGEVLTSNRSPDSPHSRPKPVFDTPPRRFPVPHPGACGFL